MPDSHFESFLEKNNLLSNLNAEYGLGRVELILVVAAQCKVPGVEPTAMQQ
jgi:hypothetical protein